MRYPSIIKPNLVKPNFMKFEAKLEIYYCTLIRIEKHLAKSDQINSRIKEEIIKLKKSMHSNFRKSSLVPSVFIKVKP